MPAAHAHRAVQLLQPLQVEVLASPLGAESGEQRLLIDVVRRERGLRGEDARSGHLLFG